MANKCNIITDSCCDFTKEEIDAAGITFLPFTYTEANKPDGGFHGTDDLFQSRSVHEFYQAIVDGACPMTSQPSQLLYEEAFEDAIASGVPTVVFTLSSGISGAYNGALTALDRVKEKHGGSLPTPIYVLDCLVGSTTQNLLLHAAIEKRDEGCTAEELFEWAETARFQTHTIFMVDNLDALHRGGRIPKSVAVVGGLLDVKPLLTFRLDGTLTIVGMARGRRKAMRKMAEFYDKKHLSDICGPVVAVGNADCEADADSLVRMLKPAEHDLKVYRSNIGPTIGCHVGSDMLSCCFWGEDRRKEGCNDAKD